MAGGCSSLQCAYTNTTRLHSQEESVPGKQKASQHPWYVYLAFALHAVFLGEL